MYSYWHLQMDEQRLDDKLEPISYNISVPVQIDVALKNSRERWMIELGVRERFREIRPSSVT